MTRKFGFNSVIIKHRDSLIWNQLKPVEDSLIIKHRETYVDRKKIKGKNPKFRLKT